MPTVLENGAGLGPEERYKHYQDKLCEYDLVIGDIVFVANMSIGKLTPNFSGGKHAILKQKGSDTFELVQVQTGKQMIRNVKFLKESSGEH